MPTESKSTMWSYSTDLHTGEVICDTCGKRIRMYVRLGECRRTITRWRTNMANVDRHLASCVRKIRKKKLEGKDG